MLSVQSLCQSSPQTGSVPQFLYRLFRHVLPITRSELTLWTAEAGAIPDEQLRRQALSSLHHKRFHADGGSVYAAAHHEWAPNLVRLIFAYQTISDYLDNLCDRSGSLDMDDFHCLHDAMRDAIEPHAPLRDYYHVRGSLDDGGYLHKLVRTCQDVVQTLPGYHHVLPRVRWFTERYCELQAYKHIQPEHRVHQLETWWSAFAPNYPDLAWWEFAAATGSTLGVFALFSAATEHPAKCDATGLADGYFPWICGLHILLDYLIDLEEDRIGGDFNFVQCYQSLDEAGTRIRCIARRSLDQARKLSQTGDHIHLYVVKGLLGMYLSDGKVTNQPGLPRLRRLVFDFGPTTWAFYAACKLYRLVR